MSIDTAWGKAYYIRTEYEDSDGNWNDNYWTRDGYYLIHHESSHDVYKVPKNYDKNKFKED